MELPARQPGDELLKPGELSSIRQRLRAVSTKHDLATVIVCAFDHRTRMLPFIVADTRMVPAGVRAIGAELVDAGFEKTRIVLQQWNKHFKPSQAKLDGRTPDILLISSMQLHWAPCQELIRDACRIPEAERPLILVGGPKTIYEPWDVFSTNPEDPASADAACTGEAFVLLDLMETLLEARGQGERIRQTFLRLRDTGGLDDILGLVYARGQFDAPAEELVDTGMQRLAGEFDELAMTALGYGILQPPSRKATLGSDVIPADRIGRYSMLNSIVLTQGCKFRCQYCPIPAYNQRQYRAKSGERILEEITQLIRQYGMHQFFGTDDNYFNDHERTIKLSETLASAMVDGKPFRRRARIGTEATVHDTIKLAEHLPLIRKAGIRAMWIGVEDMSGSLVKKGQGENETIEAFHLLREQDICVMPMMMHHDAQPLTSRDATGLLNQIKLLKKAKASSIQILMITPSSGSKMYVDAHESGMTFDAVGKRHVDAYMADGNYIIAANHPKPWTKQFNILIAYLSFYNVFRLIKHMFTLKNRLWGMDVGMQAFGMWGVAHNIRRTFGWGIRLMFCKVTKRFQPPMSKIPMRGPKGGPADHALPGTPQAPAPE
jgi:radical SAM superfamily enzyme YgiQ (UPF0313 family)